MNSRALFKSFPRVCSLRDRRARGDHVQQVLPLTSVDGGWRLVSCQAGVHIGHSDSCEHATEQQVKVRSKLHAVSLMLFQLNKKKQTVRSDKDTRVPTTHRQTQRKFIVVTPRKKRGTTKLRVWSRKIEITGRETTGEWDCLVRKHFLLHVSLLYSIFSLVCEILLDCNFCIRLLNTRKRMFKDCFWTRQEFEREQVSGATVGLVLMWVYLCCCCSASSMQWMGHYLRWHSCRRRFHCCSPLNSGQSGGKRGHAYLAGWPRPRPPLHSAAGRRRRRSGGRPSPPLMRDHGTAGPGSSEGSWETQRGGFELQLHRPRKCFL